MAGNNMELRHKTLLNPKFEILNPKQIQNSNNTKAQTKTFLFLI
jgi:hypothetical protein